MPQETGDITRLLHEWRSGSHEAENQLFDLVMPNLRHSLKDSVKYAAGL